MATNDRDAPNGATGKTLHTTLRLDFVADHYSVGSPLQAQPLGAIADFSRASPAGQWHAGRYRQLPRDTPRLSCEGLHVEHGRCNLLRHASNPGAWSTARLSGSTNAAEGPDGSRTAFVSALDQGLGQQNVDIPADTAIYTLSLYVRPLVLGQGRVLLPECGLYPHNANAPDEAWYDFASGQFGVGMRGAWRAEAYGEWTRLSVQQANNGSMIIYAARVQNDPSAQIVHGGIQLERGTQPSSLIDTGDSSALRVADCLQVAPGAWSQVAGDLRVDADPGVRVEMLAEGLQVGGHGHVRCIEFVQGLQPPAPVQLMAMNIAGAEFGDAMPGQHGHHYTWPGAANFARYAPLGLQLMRVPFRWERIQHQPYGELDHEEMRRLLAALDGAHAVGMGVLLDMHNYYQRKVDDQHYRDIGSAEVPVQAWIDAWLRLLAQVQGHPALWGYGLMNEPMGTEGRWAAGAQRCVDAIRALDGETPIIIAGDGFSTAEGWVSQNAEYFPLRGEGLIYEAHIYFDYDASGCYDDREEAIHPDKGVARAVPFFNWLKAWGQRGIIGECGVPQDMPTAMAAMDRLLTFAVANQVPVFYWAGGSQWNPGHETACEYEGELLGQVAVVVRHLHLANRIGPLHDVPDELPSLLPEEPQEPEPIEPPIVLKVASQYNPIFNEAEVADSGAAQTAYAFRFPFFIGGGDVAQLVLSLSNWYLPGSSQGQGQDTGNALPFSALAVEFNGVVQAVTSAGQRQVTLADGASDVHADPLAAGLFGVAHFEHDAMGWIKGVMTFSGTGNRVPRSWRTTHDYPGSSVLLYDPAQTALGSLDVAGELRHEGIEPLYRHSGYCPWVLGRHTTPQSRALCLRGDTLSTNYGDVANGRGSGWFQRLLGLCAIRPAALNLAVPGATALCGLDEPRLAAYLKYSPDGGCICFGSYDLDGPLAVGAEQLFARVVAQVEDCRAAGVRGPIAVGCLLPRARSSDHWATQEGQSVVPGWGADDAPARFNAMLRAYDFDLVLANDSVRSAVDRLKWRPASDPVAFDEMHPAAPGHALLAEEAYRSLEVAGFFRAGPARTTQLKAAP